MARKQPGEKRAPLASRAGRAVCTDGYCRVVFRAHNTLRCVRCNRVIRSGERFTMRSRDGKIQSSQAGNDTGRYPVCQRCGPFGDGARVQVRRAMAISAKPVRNSHQEAI